MSCINSPKVEILHTEIPFTIESCCDDRTSNALFASNGALYSSEEEDEQEPVFASDYLIPGIDTPLYFEAIEPVTLKWGKPCEYSRDGEEWISKTDTSTLTLTIPANERVYFRATGLVADGMYGIGQFNYYGKCKVGGNIMSMLYGKKFIGKTEITQENCFLRMFRTSGNSSLHLIDASGLYLPATKLTKSCYQEMFNGCSNLVGAPRLPSMRLAERCYEKMFSLCRSLSKVPELPATELSNNCYLEMFSGCTSLEHAPALHATTLAGGCYSYMFENCTNLTTAPELPAMELSKGCYSYMFSGCTSLVRAPKLNSTILNSNCYKGMFSGCTSLEFAPELPATQLVEDCYTAMFKDCTSLTKAPVLPARSLAGKYYLYMFTGCSNLNYIKMMSVSELSTFVSLDWVDGVSASGTFVKNSEATWANKFNTSAIPVGWTVELADE